MEEAYLYRQIAENIRQKILKGELKIGDQLPSMRKMMKEWRCTLGTVQRAYAELARQSLVISRVGQGTRVVGELSKLNNLPMRKASLVNRTEAFLLEVLNAGYTQDEVEQALQLALDHWREIQLIPDIVPTQVVRFNGSHDLAIDWIAAVFSEIAPTFSLKLTFSGSLNGLIALAEGKADLAGCHLWDEELSTYNLPFISRLLPGKKTAVVTIANRRLGFILPRGNPMGINEIKDLTRPGVKFINRQTGSGTRVWLDSNLHHLGISPHQIDGYTWEVATHSAVARAIAMEQANAGIGLEASAITYSLFYIPLTLERYDLVIPEDKFSFPPIQALVRWLSSSKAKEGISNLGGYDTKQTGHIQWVE